MAVAPEAPAQHAAEGLTSHTPNQLEALAQLRVPFAPEQIEARPIVECRPCDRSEYGVCIKHTKAVCDICHRKITEMHFHLDFVGHAHLTDRFLAVDPLWFWEPFAVASSGLPQFDEHGGLWIRLTVAGTTKIGYGDAEGRKGSNAVKETIGNALRNAAMRFGAALDLWANADRTEANQLKDRLADEPSRDDRLTALHRVMQREWGHQPSLESLRTQISREQFTDSLVADEHQEVRRFGTIVDERIQILIGEEELTAFLQRVREGWSDADTVDAHLAEVRTKAAQGCTDHQIPYGAPLQPTRLEDALVARVAALRNPPPAQDTGTAGTGTTTSTDGAQDDLLHDLVEAMRHGWDDAEALTKLVAEARRRGQLRASVQDLQANWHPLEDMVSARIAELKAWAAQADQNAHSDVHERAGAG